MELKKNYGILTTEQIEIKRGDSGKTASTARRRDGAGKSCTDKRVWSEGETSPFQIKKKAALKRTTQYYFYRDVINHALTTIYLSKIHRYQWQPYDHLQYHE